MAGKRARYLLERTLPDGTVKTHPNTMTARECATAAMYVLHDSAGATRQDATQAASRVQDAIDGSAVESHGYQFRLLLA